MGSKRVYEQRNVVSFARVNGKFGGLSNMSSDYPLFVNEIQIRSVEALYQACKYPLFPLIQARILRQRNAMLAKQVSRRYSMYTRQDWDNVKFDVMYWCLQIKLLQNQRCFSKILRETGRRAIVEYSTKDEIWGAKSIGNGLLEGVNAQGRLLMKLRETYINRGELLKVVHPLNITGFLLLGHPVGNVYEPEYYEEE